jgi:trypsin
MYFKGGSISQKLLKANVTIEDNSVCTFQYGSVFNGKAMLCASAPGKGPCQVSFLNEIVKHE